MTDESGNPSGAPVWANKNLPRAQRTKQQPTGPAGIGYAILGFAIVGLVVWGIIAWISSIGGSSTSAAPAVQQRTDFDVCGDVENALHNSLADQAMKSINAGEPTTTTITMALVAASNYDIVSVQGVNDEVGRATTDLNQWMSNAKGSPATVDDSDVLVFQADFLAVRSACKAAGFTSWSLDDGFK